jgi:hypothetical protein
LLTFPLLRYSRGFSPTESLPKRRGAVLYKPLTIL